MATLPNPLPRLAADPGGSTLGLELPAGRLIDATGHGPWHEPLLWCAREPATPGEWSALGPARRVGLLPLVLDTEGTKTAWQEWFLLPAEMSYPGDHDAEEFLAHAWHDHVDEEAATDHDEDYAGGAPEPFDQVTAPFGAQWPGLAPAGTLVCDPEERAAEAVDALLKEPDRFESARTALIPARRSADLPAAIGWTGPVNFVDDTARLCAVLRSWEDRFGIRVVALSEDRLVVSVAAPPSTAPQAEAVAAEHFAFCPDTIRRGNHTNLREYARDEILHEKTWTFWWD